VLCRTLFSASSFFALAPLGRTRLPTASSPKSKKKKIRTLKIPFLKTPVDSSNKHIWPTPRPRHSPASGRKLGIRELLFGRSFCNRDAKRHLARGIGEPGLRHPRGGHPRGPRSTASNGGQHRLHVEFSRFLPKCAKATSSARYRSPWPPPQHFRVSYRPAIGDLVTVRRLRKQSTSAWRALLNPGDEVLLLYHRACYGEQSIRPEL